MSYQPVSVVERKTEHPDASDFFFLVNVIVGMSGSVFHFLVRVEARVSGGRKVEG